MSDSSDSMPARSCDRNFFGLRDNAAMLGNQQSVVHDYTLSQVDSIAREISIDMQHVSKSVKERCGNAPPGVYKEESDSAAQVASRLISDEYETWQLVSEIFAAEKVYFDRNKSKAFSAQVCPKTLEQD